VKTRPCEVLELVPMEPLGMFSKKKAAEWVLPPRPDPKDKMLETAPDQIKETIAALREPTGLVAGADWRRDHFLLRRLR
jgi:hypothetical protein